MYGPASSKVTLLICKRNLALVSSCDTDILSLLLITCFPMAWIALVSAFNQPIWKKERLLIKIGFFFKGNCSWVHKDSKCPYVEAERNRRVGNLSKVKNFHNVKATIFCLANITIQTQRCLLADQLTLILVPPGFSYLPAALKDDISCIEMLCPHRIRSLK